MAHEVGTFLGEARCYKYRYSHICGAHQSNALLQYMYVLVGHGDTYIDLCMTRSTINQPVQQHQF